MEIGSRVQINDQGRRFLGMFKSLTELEDSSGAIYGTLVGNDVYQQVTLEKGGEEVFMFSPREVEEAAPLKTKKSLTELVELLYIYRNSEDDDEVQAAQDLLIELYMEA